MNSIFLHLIIPFSAVFELKEDNKKILSINSQEALGNEICLEITELDNANTFSLSVYPIETTFSRLVPYQCSFSFNGNILQSDSQYVQVFTLPQNHYLLRFLPLSIELNRLNGDKLEIENNKVKRLKLLNDMAGRAKVEIFANNDKELCKEEEFTVLIDKAQNQIVPDELLLLDFFESLIAKDFSSATGLLSNELKDKLNKEKLQNFFGIFSICYPINYFDVPAIVLLYEESKTCLLFCSTIADGKIKDIYELNI